MKYRNIYLNRLNSNLYPATWDLSIGNSEKGTFVLAMMQEMVENHGDGYSYMMERVNNYIERILAAKKGFSGKNRIQGKFNGAGKF